MFDGYFLTSTCLKTNWKFSAKLLESCHADCDSFWEIVYSGFRCFTYAY